ncbi:MAG: hypothetical protein JOZ78_21950 [Chroococcidiopsidaceae cyanobacterium CP_BM_ER_R8_30]|nr:hypothetical protein [Chroococcidiopsidaceae cyanobacterium CP_BM_ER_R8_30]
MVRLYVVGFVQTALLSLGLGLNVGAAAAATFNFSGIYNITATLQENIPPNFQAISLSGTSTNAPYDLTRVNSLSYSQTDFTTGVFSSNTDPTAFGLQGYQPGYVEFSGNGSNILIASASGAGAINFAQGTVTTSDTLAITGGQGMFSRATGTLTSTQVVPASIQPGVALEGQYSVSGTIETVPEPGFEMAPLIMGVIAAGILWHRGQPNRKGCPMTSP